MKKIVEEIQRVAKTITDTNADLTRIAMQTWVDVESVRKVYAGLASKMDKKGMTKIRMATLIEAAESWEKCISDAEKNPDVKDPEALCGWLKSHGPNAPAGDKKGPFKK